MSAQPCYDPNDPMAVKCYQTAPTCSPRPNASAANEKAPTMAINGHNSIEVSLFMNASWSDLERGLYGAPLEAWSVKS